ncbi:copper resistance protein CopC [Streptomyces angustmyceticus]|uniref:copper resistance CopC/CopD family protein n=2 Tax=Streptomyces angustmyceticus TaxID=285578 RepID=UPI0014792A24|nr:copper resistance protein CopC [Streptomyces angustmyceticus]UAL69152.1 copper resistance protein CopC [Streptomyces angustmyceticus]
MLLLLASAWGLLLGGAGTASAHAKVSSTAPAEGAIVKTAPKTVAITFSETMSLPDQPLRVFAPDGKRVRTGPAGWAPDDHATIRAALPDGLAKGTYTVSWRAVSADSHPISGAFAFSIGKASPHRAVVPTDSPAGEVTGALYGVARGTTYAGYALMVGVAAFAVLCLPRGMNLRPLRRLMGTGWGLLLASTVTQLLLRAPYESGSGPGGALDVSALRNTLISDTGQFLTARVALLLGTWLLWNFLGQRLSGDLAGGPRKAVLAVGAVIAAAVAGTWSLAEHASVGPQVALAVPVSVVHSVAMAVWLGGLAALLVALRRAAAEDDGVDAVAARFSRLAFGAVAALVLTGIYQSWRQVGSWHALGSTLYGKVLLAKVGAVLLMLLAAGLSRRWTRNLRPLAPRADIERDRTPEVHLVAVPSGARSAVRSGASVEAGPVDVASAEALSADEDAHTSEAGGTSGGVGAAPARLSLASHTVPRDAETPARRALRRSVAVETAVSGIVLALTALLTGTDPGRNDSRPAPAGVSPASAGERAAAFADIPFDTGAPKGRGKGKVAVTVDPATTGTNALNALVRTPDGGVAVVPELKVTLTLPGKGLGPLPVKMKKIGGYWAAEDFEIPFPGKWKVTVTVRTSDTEQDTETAPLEIG